MELVTKILLSLKKENQKFSSETSLSISTFLSENLKEAICEELEIEQENIEAILNGNTRIGQRSVALLSGGEQ